MGEYIKKALIRREGYPIGVPAPCYFVCVCGAEVDAESDCNVCAKCGTKYDGGGWIIR